MVVVKLTTSWQQDYYNQTPAGKGIFGQYKFEVNNGCATCDYWIIWGGLKNKEKVMVNPGNVIYVTDEAHDQRIFNNEFLKQFSTIASVRKDLEGDNIVVPIHEFAPWYFNKSYDFLSALQPPKKTKTIAVISSNLTWLQGHKKRFDFVNSIIAHFKDKLDVYGRGFNEIADKYDALIDYKYSVAIENNYISSYFTEKISECFLTYTMPIYYGCPDIDTYYDKRSILTIDINDYESTFKKIEELIDTDPYSNRLPFIADSREHFLHDYHMFPAMIKLIERIKENQQQNIYKSFITILPESGFLDNNKKAVEDSLITRSANIFKRIIKRFDD